MEKAQKKKHWARRIILLAGAMLLLFGVLLIGSQTPPAKRFMAAQLSDLLSEALPWPVAVEGIGGLLPFSPTVDAITLGPQDNPWLTLHNAALKLGALPLLGGNVTIERVAAESITLHHLPPSNNDDPNATTSLSLPEIVRLPTWIRVNQLQVAQVLVDESVAGHGMEFEVDGAYLPAESDGVTLAVKGAPGTDAEVSLKAGLQDGTVSLLLEATDNGLVRAFSGVEGPFALHGSLDGPLSDANLTLELVRANETIMTLNAELEYAVPLNITGTGKASLPQDLVPSSLRDKLGETLSLALNVSIDAQKGINIQDTSIQFAHGRIELGGRYETADQTVKMVSELHYDDLYLLLGQPREGDPVALGARVPLEGSLAELNLKPEVQLGGAPWIDGDMALTLTEIKSAQGHLRVHDAGGLVPDAYWELLAEGAGINLDASYATSMATVRQARIEAGSTVVDLRGTFDISRQSLDMAASASIGALHDFEGIVGHPMAGTLQLELVANGDAGQTTASGTVALSDLQVDTVKAPSGQMSLSLAGGTLFTANALTQHLALSVDGAFPGLQLKPELARDLTLKGAASLEDLHRLTIDTFALDDGNLHASADGTVDLETRVADLVASLDMKQFADYAVLTGKPWRGNAGLKAKVASGESPGTLNIDVSGALGKLAGLPDVAQGLTGSSVTLSGAGHFDGTIATVSAFDIASKNLKASATGSFDKSSQRLAASLKSEIADLAPLGTAVARPMSGAASVAMEASGDIDAMAVSGTISSNAIHIDALRADSSSIRFTASGLPANPQLEVNANLEKSGEPFDLHARFSKRGSVLSLSEFSARTGDNALSGSGTFDLDGKNASGVIDAELPQLATLKTWLELPLEGSLNLKAALDPDTGQLTGSLDSERMVIPGISLENALGHFDISHPRTAPAGTIALDATGLQAGDWQVESLSLNAEGPAEAWRITLNAKGDFKEATSFTIESGGVLARESGTFNLDALQLGAEGNSFALRAPAEIIWGEGHVVLAPVALQGDAGTILVSGDYAPEALDLHATLEEVSLRLAALTGIDPPAGTLSAQLDLSGTPAAPTLAAETIIKGYNPNPDGDNQFAGLDAAVTANYSEGTLHAVMSSSVPDAAQLVGETTLGMTWSISPWNLSLGQDRPLQGTLKGSVDLTAIPALLALDDQALRGDLQVDLTLAGLRAEPTLSGFATISDGYYEHGATSTILNDLEARLEAEGNTLRLVEFAANDGEDGTYTADGQIALQSDGGIPYHLNLKLGQPRLVYRDDLRAQGGGNLRIEGDEKGAHITGDLQVGPAFVTLPEQSATTRVATVPFTVAGEVLDPDAPVAKGPYPISIDIKAALPGRVFFRGPGLDSEWKGALTATGEARNPSVRGTLSVKKGTLDFLGRVFNLAESTISFDGETPPAPYLRIAAVTETDGIVARVRMEGLHNALTITLESEPPLPRDEILSRVLFGQRLSDVSPVQALTLARYAPIFSRNATAQTVLGSGAPKPFLVDRFSVQGGTGVGEASVTTGKYLTDDLYLEFEQGLGSAQNLVSLEWLFAPRWSLKARTTSQGEGGVGVFWKKNY